MWAPCFCNSQVFQLTGEHAPDPQQSLNSFYDNEIGRLSSYVDQVSSF